jgi:hypothetical protein
VWDGCDCIDLSNGSRRKHLEATQPSYLSEEESVSESTPIRHRAAPTAVFGRMQNCVWRSRRRLYDTNLYETHDEDARLQYAYQVGHPRLDSKQVRKAAPFKAGNPTLLGQRGR